MENFLSQLIAIIAIGLFLRFAYFLYEIIREKITNWKYMLCLCVIAYIIAFGFIAIFPENNLLTNIIAAILFVFATASCFMALFSYGESKKKK